MPVESQSHAQDNSDTYWLGQQEEQEEQDLSDVDSESSDTTTRSMSTLGSMEVSRYFREVYGRTYPADGNIPSFVPLDNGEAARLELQHHYLKLLIGSNYFGPVESILSPDPSRRKRVLDIFTTDGTWAQEMATEFPHVDFVSLDIVPLVPHTPRANIAFEVYDLYNGLTEPDDSFDIVHTRRTIRDYPEFLREVSRVLRPGGLLLFGQIEVEVYEYTAPDKSNPTDPGETLYPGPHVVQARHSLPVMSYGMTLLRDSLLTQLIRVHMWRELPGLLAPDSSLWQSGGTKSNAFQTQPEMRQSQRIAGVRSASGFREVVTTSHILPTAPWHPSPRLRAIGEIVQQIGESNWRNFGLLFRQHGLSELETDNLIDAGLRESASCECWQVMRYHTVYASKA